MCFFRDFWAGAKTVPYLRTRSKWAHLGRRKCTHFYSFSEAKNTRVHKATRRNGWWAHLGRRKCTHFFSSVCVFSRCDENVEKKKLIRKHDHESWNFRSESEPILNRLLNSFAAEPCPHWENWQHFRRPKWAHFERVPWPRPVFARVQKSWKKHIKTNAFWTVYWIVLMNLGWRVGDV